MERKAYLNMLGKALGALPANERKSAVARFGELIDAKMSEGASADLAVSELGGVPTFAEEALADAEARGVKLKRIRSRGARAFLAAAGTILFLAAAAFIVLAALGLFNETEWAEGKRDFEFSRTDSLFVELDSYDLLIGVSDDSLLHISYAESEFSKFSFEKKADGLHVRQTQTKHIANVFRRSLKRAVILMPPRFSGSITVRSTSGETHIEGPKGFDMLDVYLIAGDIFVSGVSAQNAELSYTSGSVNIDGLEVGSLLRLNGAAGTSSVKNLKAHTFDLNVAAGSMELSGVVAEISRITATSGSVYFTDYDSQDISINLTTGSANGMLKGKLSDYEIDCGTLTGNCNLPSENNGGPRKLYGRCTTGRIHMYFENEERGNETPVPDWYW